MSDYGTNWCDRCAVLALHSPANSGDSLTAPQLLEQCQSDGFLSSNQLPSGESPAPIRTCVST